jgi:signal transduction histidine kinase
VTIRLRLTLLYGGLFLAAGAALLAVTYLLVAHSPWPGEPDPPDAPALDLPEGGPDAPEPSGPEAPELAGWVEDQRDVQRDEDLRQLLAGSLVALGLMTVASAALGWLVAGRALRPIATMTATVRHISADDLHRRLAASGPADELKGLADTFDQLLDRLEAAFESQRRFVANASHELRTPLTLQRTLVDVALADPEADVATLRATCQQVLGGVEEQERLIDALLVLARSQRGLTQRRPVDLSELTRRLLDERRDAAARGVQVTATLGPAFASGDPDLLERLVANLFDNALVHNVDDGWIEVATGTTGGRATLRIANSGQTIGEERIATLLEPFHADRTRVHRNGLGLGLSIVDAITRAHGGAIHLEPLPAGGLTVTIQLPREPAR